MTKERDKLQKELKELEVAKGEADRRAEEYEEAATSLPKIELQLKERSRDLIEAQDQMAENQKEVDRITADLTKYKMALEHTRDRHAKELNDLMKQVADLVQLQMHYILKVGMVTWASLRQVGGSFQARLVSLM